MMLARWKFATKNQKVLSPPERGTAAPFSAHVYCGQTVAHLSHCWALVWRWQQTIACSKSESHCLHYILPQHCGISQGHSYDVPRVAYDLTKISLSFLVRSLCREKSLILRSCCNFFFFLWVCWLVIALLIGYLIFWQFFNLNKQVRQQACETQIPQYSLTLRRRP